MNVIYLRSFYIYRIIYIYLLYLLFLFYEAKTNIEYLTSIGARGKKQFSLVLPTLFR